tara:strand:+ start:2682 stop:3011 length:330 start_codon:yes stop_codon:yes gene_type:complete
VHRLKKVTQIAANIGGIVQWTASFAAVVAAQSPHVRQALKYRQLPGLVLARIPSTIEITSFPTMIVVVHRLAVTAYASEMRVIAQSIILVSPMILTGALEQQAQFIIAL